MFKMPYLLHQIISKSGLRQPIPCEMIVPSEIVKLLMLGQIMSLSTIGVQALMQLKCF